MPPGRALSHFIKVRSIGWAAWTWIANHHHMCVRVWLSSETKTLEITYSHSLATSLGQATASAHAPHTDTSQLQRNRYQISFNAKTLQCFNSFPRVSTDGYGMDAWRVWYVTVSNREKSILHQPPTPTPTTALPKHAIHINYYSVSIGTTAWQPKGERREGPLGNTPLPLWADTLARWQTTNNLALQYMGAKQKLHGDLATATINTTNYH